MSNYRSSWVLASLAATLWLSGLRAQHSTLAAVAQSAAPQRQTEAEAKARLTEQYLYAARMTGMQIFCNLRFCALR